VATDPDTERTAAPPAHADSAPRPSDPFARARAWSEREEQLVAELLGRAELRAAARAFVAGAKKAGLALGQAALEAAVHALVRAALEESRGR